MGEWKETFHQIAFALMLIIVWLIITFFLFRIDAPI
jgi:hypothetical protein